VASPESADSSLSAGSSVENGGLTMARKRVLSTTPTVEAEQIITRKKRHRVSSISLQLNNPIQLDTLFVSPTVCLVCSAPLAALTGFSPRSSTVCLGVSTR
jgi:hypothetical protein